MSDSPIKPSPVALEVAILTIRRAGVHLAEDLIAALRVEQDQAIDALLASSGDELRQAQGFAVALRMLVERLTTAEARVRAFNKHVGDNQARKPN